jgi:hypothetical protein
MRRGAAGRIIAVMTRPTPSRVLLVADDRAANAAPVGTPVRRYRLARLRLEGRSSDPKARFEHLKRVYD